MIEYDGNEIGKCDSGIINIGMSQYDSELWNSDDTQLYLEAYQDDDGNYLPEGKIPEVVTGEKDKYSFYYTKYAEKEISLKEFKDINNTIKLYSSDIIFKPNIAAE